MSAKYDGMIGDGQKPADDGKQVPFDADQQAAAEEEIMSGDQRALAIPDGGFQEITLDASHLNAPPMYFTYKTSKVVEDGLAKPGEYYMQGFPAMPEVTFIPWYALRQHALMPGKKKMDYSRLCWSAGDADPAKEHLLIGQGDPGHGVLRCIDCQLSKWNNGEPPACSNILTYVGYVATLSQRFTILATISFSNMGYTAGERILQIVGMNKMGGVPIRLGKGTRNSKNFKDVLVPTAIPDISEAGWEAVERSQETYRAIFGKITEANARKFAQQAAEDGVDVPF